MTKVLCPLLNASCGVILMRNINLFVEDVAHEDFLSALMRRLAHESNIEISIKPSNVRGGHGTVITELEQYIRDLHHNKEDLPDLVIVGTDSNCKSLSEREKVINEVVTDLSDIVISMIPEPHIERWLLLDSGAFKVVYGKGCPDPDRKCERKRFKNLLLQAIRDATTVAPIDGFERVEELVYSMDFQRMKQSDKSICRFLTPLQRQFRIWEQVKN